MNLFAHTRLFDVFNKVKKLDEGKIFVDVISEKQVQRFIVELNTDQLRFQFMNSEGVPLSDIGGEYSPFTMNKAQKKGQPKKSQSDVDLYDEGDYHRSFRIDRIRATSFDITSDPVKDDGTNLLAEWGAEIEGLTFESLAKASEYMLSFYQDKLRGYLA